MDYILDTNICIYLIKKKPMSVFEQFNKLPLGSIGISSITLAELQYGVHKSNSPEKNQSALSNFLLPLEIAYFDDSAAREYGNIRSQLEQVGKPIGPLDTLIAGHVKSIDAVLVTNNEKEFSRVSGLKIENWVS
jgi:tRNA(fMet)-specific endonuclease VapC